jgi:ketosteroid isomerase-like protein
MKPVHRLPGRIVLSLVTLYAYGMPSAGATEAGTGSAAEVEDVLARFSAALCAGDATTLRLLMAPDFALLEEGRAYDGDGAIASITAVLSTGALSRASSQFHTRIRGNVAWSHYRVTGQFRGSGEPLPLDLLESAVLERTRSGWRLVLVTTMPQGSGSEKSQ